ncbi:MAG: PDZ domain-containing protein [Proteobacteria bacterium]|nr:PDZ domain-containing protein [Pseudomonadota bacterium]
MHPDRIALHPRKFLMTLATCLLLSGCVSYEPAVLVPSITLSADEISLVNETDNRSASIDFGLETSLNESDSLANVEILPGVRVRSIVGNGAADSAGIQVGDIILMVNGTATDHPDAILALQNSAPAPAADESEFKFKVRRNTVVFEATVIGRLISKNPPPQELYRVDPLATRAGYRSEIVTIRNRADLVAAKVVEFFPGSPLPAANIKEGDLILSLNGINLNSAQDLVSRLNQEFELGENVVLGVYDGQAVTEVPIQLWDPGRRISQFSLWPLFSYSASLNPASNSLTILDFWLFSLYSYERLEGERSHSIFGLFNFSTDYGELTEESN